MARHEDKAFYNSNQWLSARKYQLSKEPLCVECKKYGKVKPATQVDHIVPIAAGGDRLNQDNLQSLCHRHHSQKTAREDGGFGMKLVVSNVYKGCDANGYPLDPRHPWNTVGAYPRPDQELPL